MSSIAANNIKYLRKLSGLSQEKLGDMIGCNKSKISKLENNNQELTQNWMVKISRALNNTGLQTVPADILPAHEHFINDIEEECSAVVRELTDSQKEEFRAMISQFKR